MPYLSRYDDVLDLVREHAAATPALRLAIVGGSAATGRYDEHSDLDLELWAEGDPAPAYDALRDLLLASFATHHPWERPADTSASTSCRPARPGPTWPDRADRAFAGAVISRVEVVALGPPY